MQEVEAAKVSIRNARKQGVDAVKGMASEDERYRAEAEVRRETDEVAVLAASRMLPPPPPPPAPTRLRIPAQARLTFPCYSPELRRKMTLIVQKTTNDRKPRWNAS